MLKEMLGMAEGVLQDLHNDHTEISDLIEKILKTNETQTRSALFRELMTKLLAHSHAEHGVVYRKLEKSDAEAARKFALQANNEHQIVEQQLQQMARARGRTMERAALRVAQSCDIPLNDEESTGCSCLRREFDRDELDKTGQQFQRQKNRLIVEA